MKKPAHNIIAVLEDVRSALNVGAMFRTADGAGIAKLILAGITPYPPHNRIPKTALGATESVNWQHVRQSELVYENLQKEGIPVIAVELTDTAVPYTEFSYPEPVALVFGNEIHGVSEQAKAIAAKTVYIPMFGSKESLNVATCFGIVLYEVVRQYAARNRRN